MPSRIGSGVWRIEDQSCYLRICICKLVRPVDHSPDGSSPERGLPDRRLFPVPQPILGFQHLPALGASAGREPQEFPKTLATLLRVAGEVPCTPRLLDSTTARRREVRTHRPQPPRTGKRPGEPRHLHFCGRSSLFQAPSLRRKRPHLCGWNPGILRRRGYWEKWNTHRPLQGFHLGRRASSRLLACSRGSRRRFRP